MNEPALHLSPEHRALLRFLSRVHQDNGLRPLRVIAAAMHLKSKSRVSCLLRGDNNTLPADEIQLDALVLAIGGGTDELRRARELYRKARRSRGISRRVAHPPQARRDALVGRQQELDRIHHRIAELACGRGSALLVEGEPGIGKTALARAAEAAAEAAGCQVLRATCDELGQIFPLSPLLDMLVDADRSIEYAEINAILRREVIAGTETSTVAMAADRLLASIADGCAEHPVLVIVDDLQWADPVTVMTVSRMIRTSHRQPVGVLGLMRPVPQRDDLESLRAAVGPDDRIPLHGLPDDAVVALVQSVTGAPPGPRLRRLVAGAGGNPLYLVELLDAVVRDGALLLGDDGFDVADDQLPTSLHQAIAARLAFLSQPAREVVRLAAMLGNDVPLAELEAISGRRVGGDLETVLDEAIAAGVLRAGGSGLSFRHPLIRATLYQQSPPAMRAAWHHRAGQELAAVGMPPERVARQLLPALQFDEWPPDRWTVEWLAHNGLNLVGRAPAAAVSLLRSAIAVTPVGEPPHDVLVCRLACALYHTGAADEAAAIVTAALSYVTDPDLLVDLHATLAQASGFLGQSEQAFAVLDNAVATTRPGSREQARLLVLAARIRCGQAQVQAAADLATRALDIAEAEADQWATAWALGVLFITRGMLGDEAGALVLAQRTLAICGQDPTLSDLQLLLRINQASALGALDRGAEAIAMAELAVSQAEQAGDGIRLSQARSVLGELLFDAGRWDDCLEIVNATPESVKGPGVASCDYGCAAQIRLHRGEPADGDLRAADRYAGRIGHRIIGNLLLAHGLDKERSHGPAAGLAVLALSVRGSSEELDQQVNLYPHVVRLALAVNDRELANTVCRRAADAAARSAAPNRAAVAQHCRGLFDGDPATLVAAAERYAATHRPLQQAQALEAAGAIAADGQQRAAARRHLAEARGIYRALAANADLARLTATARQYRLRLTGSPPIGRR